MRTDRCMDDQEAPVSQQGKPGLLILQSKVLHQLEMEILLTVKRHYTKPFTLPSTLYDRNHVKRVYNRKSVYYQWMAKLTNSHSNYKTAKTGIKSGCANSLNKDKQSLSSKIHTGISVIKLLSNFNGWMTCDLKTFSVISG